MIVRAFSPGPTAPDVVARSANLKSRRRRALWSQGRADCRRCCARSKLLTIRRRL